MYQTVALAVLALFVGVLLYEDDSMLIEEEVKQKREVSMYAPAVYQLCLAMDIGTITSFLLSKTGMTFPIYNEIAITSAFSM